MKYLILLFCSSVYADNQLFIDQVGSYNNLTINQSSSISASTYADIHVNGDHNVAIITQESISGYKNATLTLNGTKKSVEIVQQGTGNHQASVSLSGENSGLNLFQVGSISQSYSLTFNCTTPGGCAPIQVYQGQ